MDRKTGRRGFLRGALMAGVSAAGTLSPEERRLLQAGVEPTPPRTPPGRTDLPTGKLGKLNVSRLIAGGNLISGWCHQRDLLYVSKLAKAYLTEQKQFDTLALCEKWGINAIVIDQDQLGIVNKYRKERKGRIQTIVGVRQAWDRWKDPGWEDLKGRIDRAIDEGADAPFLHGGYADRLVERGRREQVEILGKAIEYIRSRGLPAGLGSHALEVPQECDKLGIVPDFYFKTFHHDQYWSATPKERRKRFCVDGPRSLDHNEFHDNIFCIDPEETAAYMREKKQPWIAFKVLAAGAIHPKSGFRYAFENGADFVAVGMFDFDVFEDVTVAQTVLESLGDRARPWPGGK